LRKNGEDRQKIARINSIKPYVRVRLSPIQLKLEPNAVKPDPQTENLGGGSVEEEKPGNGEKPGHRITIVEDSIIEAKGAFQWALPHTVQTQDIMIFLHVTKLTQQGLNSSCISSFGICLWLSICLDGGL